MHQWRVRRKVAAVPMTWKNTHYSIVSRRSIRTPTWSSIFLYLKQTILHKRIPTILQKLGYNDTKYDIII
jgi:hypothetical protein